MTLVKAIHSQALSPGGAGAEVPRRIQVFPQGRFPGLDGRGPYECDAAKVAAATRDYFGGIDIPVDYDHQLEYAEANGQPAIASGWVTALEHDGEGLWAVVDWTAKAAAHIAAREYRYVSPVFFHDKDGVIRRLESIALTNLPNLPLKALASRDNAANEKEDGMSLKALYAALGLSESATEAEALERAKGLAADVEKAKAARAEAEAELEKAKAAREETDKPDPAKFVPVGALKEVSDQLAELKARAAQDAADRLVGDGVKAGKISPAMSEWAKAYAAKDPEGFKAFMAQSPVLAPGGGKDGGAGTGPPTAGEQLSDEEKAVCRMTGISEEAYTKARAAQGAAKEA